MPNRRVAIQQLLLIWAGVAFLPACLPNDRKVSIPLTQIHIEADDEMMLSELTETILPKTESPGAKDLSANLFVLKMVDDCFTKVDQDKYVKGMKAFEDFVHTKTGKSFVNSDAAGRQAIVAGIDKQQTADPITFFYQSTKKLTVEAYTTSEIYMTKIRGYKMIPGRYYGCVPLKTA